MEECSVGYNKMDMDNVMTMSWKDHVRGKYSLILLVSGSIALFMLLVMVFVIFNHQEGKFAELDNFLQNHNSFINSMNSDLNGKLQKTGTELQAKVAELKTSMSSLTSYIDLYTSRTLDQLNKGPQVKKLSDIQSLINNLGSSLGSLSSKLETMLQDTAHQQGTQNTQVKTLVESLNSSVSELASKLQSTIVHQDKKLAEIGGSLAPLNSALTSFASQLKNLTEASVYQNEKNRMVESSVQNLTTSVETLDSSIKSNDERTMTALSAVKSELESMNQSAVSQNRMLSEVQASVLKLSSPMESLSNIQSTVQRVFAALNDMQSKLENKGSTAALASCKPGWISYLSWCYSFSTNKLNWHQARDYCKTQNAMLLKVDTENEWEFIKKNVKRDYWVGLTDEFTGQWRWEDGTPFPIISSQWDPGQPDDWKDHGLGEEGEDCGHIKYSLKLNDMHCSELMTYICKA